MSVVLSGDTGLNAKGIECDGRSFMVVDWFMNVIPLSVVLRLV